MNLLATATKSAIRFSSPYERLNALPTKCHPNLFLRRVGQLPAALLSDLEDALRLHLGL